MDRNDLLATTRAEFLQAFLGAVEKSIPPSLEDFFHKADTTFIAQDRNNFFDARRILEEKSGSLMLHMQESMEQLLTRSFQTSYNTFRPSFSSTYSGNSLALLDASVYEDELRINEISGQFRNEAEENLRDLNIRIAQVFEQDDIQERENPFRPYLCARCIASAVAKLGKPAAINSIIMEQIAANITHSMDDIYGNLNAYLVSKGIGTHLQLKIKKSKSQPAKPRAPAQEIMQGGAGGIGGGSATQPLGDPGHAGLVTAQKSAASMGDQRMEELLAALHGIVGNLGASEQSLNRMAAPPAHENPGLTPPIPLDSLRQFFSNGSAQPAPAIPPQKARRQTKQTVKAAAAPVPAASEKPEQPEGLRNLIQEYRASPASANMAPGDQMTADVLGMLYQFILHDRQVPESIRIQFGRMQALLLQAALRDTSLLTKKDPPVRKLINRIATIALGMQQIDPELKHLAAEVSRIVDILLGNRTEKASLSQNMLDDFEMFVHRELRDASGTTQRAMQLAEAADALTIRPQAVPNRLAQALTGLALESNLRDFLENIWIMPVQLAEQSDPELAKRFKLLVPELLWSSVPKISRDDRKQLFAMLPTILATIREGLSLIGWSAEQQQTLWNRLVDVHTNALRIGDPALVAPSLPATYEHFAAFIADPGTASPPLAPELVDDETVIDQASRESGIDVRHLDLVFDQDLQEVPPLAADSGCFDLNTDEHLRSGTPIDIVLSDPALGEGPQPGILLWLSAKKSHLLLMLANDNRPSAIRVSTLQRLLAARHARFQETSPLFERAVQSILISTAQLEAGT